jgi:hypothetical protein
VRRQLEPIYGFLSPDRDYYNSKPNDHSYAISPSAPKQSSRTYPTSAAINAVAERPSHTPEEKLAWLQEVPTNLQLCPWCFCKGGTLRTKANGHTLLTCPEANAKGVRSSLYVAKTFGDSALIEWKQAVDKLRAASSSTEDPSSSPSLVPSRPKPTLSSKSTQSKPSIHFIEEATASDDDYHDSDPSDSASDSIDRHTAIYNIQAATSVDPSNSDDENGLIYTLTDVSTLEGAINMAHRGSTTAIDPLTHTSYPVTEHTK